MERSEIRHTHTRTRTQGNDDDTKTTHTHTYLLSRHEHKSQNGRDPVSRHTTPAHTQTVGPSGPYIPSSQSVPAQSLRVLPTPSMSCVVDGGEYDAHVCVCMSSVVAVSKTSGFSNSNHNHNEHKTQQNDNLGLHSFIHSLVRSSITNRFNPNPSQHSQNGIHE